METQPRAASGWFAWKARGVFVMLWWIAVLAPQSLRADEEVEHPVLPLSSLQEAVAGSGRAIMDFTVEGTVCAIGSSPRSLVMQDESGTYLLEVPSVPEQTGEGKRVRIEGRNCTLTRGRFGIQLATGPVAEADGHHSKLTRSGTTFLKEGMQPLRMEWFNGISDMALGLEYSGPGIERQKVAASSLFYRADGGGDFLPGLRYQSYIGNEWPEIPAFEKLVPVKSGVVADFDISVQPRPQYSGLVFSGFIKIPAAGSYEFFLTSDDGARVFVGDVPVSCSILPGDGTVKISPWSARGGPADGEWVSAEGDVTYAARNRDRLELDLTSPSSSFHVMALGADDVDPATLHRHRVKVRGIGTPEGILVVDSKYLEPIGNAQEELLTWAGQVRSLQPEEASKPYRARLRGVVINASPTSLVIQDLTGGVFVLYSSPTSTGQPRPGEVWEIEGKTDPGDFSPMILAERVSYVGSAPMPEAVRATWDQLASGSLDAERVEVEGVVVSASDAGMVLITRGGRLQINANRFNPVPFHDMDAAARKGLPGSVVRVRGVYTASWDKTTGRVNPGICQLSNATMTVDEPSSRDPFAAAAMQASDLLLFTSHPGPFKRVKVTGVVLHARPPEFFLSDGIKGFRIVSADAPALEPGERVEAAGFPRLGGPSPVLLETKVRQIARDSLPAAAAISAEKLPDAKLDSTRVQMTATLLSDAMRQDERVIEAQAGNHRFVARLAGRGRDAKPIERGSLLQLTGTYASTPLDRPSSAAEPFEILLNDPADLIVLHRGPWWTVRRTIIGVAILAGGLLLALGWVLSLRRTVALRGRQLAKEIEGREAIERHRAMESERARVAQDLHDELGSGLTEAGILTSLVQNTAIPQEKKDGYLMQLGEVCRGLVTGLDEIVWAVNPRYDSVTDLAGYFSLFAQRFLELAGIQCRLKIDDSVAGHPLDSRRRHGLFLAFKEALNNIVRHSGASEVMLEISVVADRLGISLADNGRGFAVAEDSPGSDGLAGMSARMDKLGGACRVDTQPGRGTTVEFSLTLERNGS